MTGDQFQKIVTARADERVQKRIADFKRAVLNAVDNLLSLYSYRYNEDRKAIYQIMASADDKKGWPAKLWELEEKKVTEELLATMDELQKAFLAYSNKTAGENTKQETIPSEKPVAAMI